MGYLIVGILGFALGATKGDDLERTVRSNGKEAKQWKDY